MAHSYFTTVGGAKQFLEARFPSAELAADYAGVMPSSYHRTHSEGSNTAQAIIEAANRLSKEHTAGTSALDYALKVIDEILKGKAPYAKKIAEQVRPIILEDMEDLKLIQSSTKRLHD